MKIDQEKMYSIPIPELSDENTLIYMNIPADVLPSASIPVSSESVPSAPASDDIANPECD